MKILLKKLPEEVLRGSEELAAQLGLDIAENGIAVLAERGACLRITRTKAEIRITYRTLPDYFRAFSMIGRLREGDEISEVSNDGLLCLMSDNSRNAVMTVESAKKTIRYLALMGYNSLMLYTEETYEMPEYPYFGYLRGRYTAEELREIDQYAALFGIEVIPCIQALAHLSKALQWGAFSGVSDTADILLVGEEETYRLIETMLKTCRAAFRSDRINLGMDEAHMLGRGRYLDKNGYRPAPEIMLEHLARVTELCKKYGYEPMIWSDMFFRMAFDGVYRVREGEVPPEVAAKVPQGLTLIYWDYYSLDRGIFSHMLDCHKKFPNNQTAFAGGAWCWSGFAPCNRFSIVSTEMQLALCREYGMKDLIVTAWGDNGHEASMFTALPVLLYFAEHAYGASLKNEDLEIRASSCFGIGYEELLLLDAPNEMPNRDQKKISNPCKYLLFNDPLLGIFDLHMDAATVSAGFAEAEQRLLPLAEHPQFGYIYKTLAALCRVLVNKADLGVRLRAAYQAGDRAALRALALSIDGIVADLDAFTEIFRAQWMAENKAYGFEVQDQRLGGLRARLLATKGRVLGYVDNEITAIEELESAPLPFRPIADGESPYGNFNIWSRQVTACIL